jgi:hypothetical protein
VAQHMMEKAIQDAKDQAHDYEVIMATENVPSKPLNSYKTKFQKITIELSRKLTLFVIEELKDLHCVAQQIVFEKFLAQLLV